MSSDLKLIILRGLPACGKSSWCYAFFEEVNKDNTWVRVSTEDFRFMLNFGVLSSDYEMLMHALCVNTIMTSLMNGFNVVYDADNLNLDHTEKVIKAVETFHSERAIANATVIYKDFFDVPVEECIRRDAQRDHSVGADTINKLNDLYKEILKDSFAHMSKH